jgi:putative hydrolase
MTGLARIDEDFHVHSTFSVGISTLAENAAAAASRGLRTLCLADHVRTSTTWVPEFAAAVSALRPPPGMELLAGLEAKILDRSGRLDMPPVVSGIDLILIADHQFPSDHGPVDPAELAAMLRSGAISADEVVAGLAEATANAMDRAGRPLLAHLFSVLPKAGLSESDVPDDLLDELARRAGRAGALVEVNEKWACPSPRVVSAFARAGAGIVASTDSHDCAAVGQYSYVRATMDSCFAGSGR